jgi:formate hydrogenlyase subunit 4
MPDLRLTGLVLWIDAFEWIALFCILILIYFSVGTQPKEKRKLSIWWARMGLFIAFLTFIDFSADVLRLEDWQTFTEIAIVVAVVNTLMLLPSWLIILSCTLHKVMPDYSEQNDLWNPQLESAA